MAVADGGFNRSMQQLDGIAQPLACEPVKSVRQQVIDICGQCQPHVPMIVCRHADEKFPASPLVGQSNRLSAHNLRAGHMSNQPQTRRSYGKMEWPALLRKLDRIDPSCRR